MTPVSATTNEQTTHAPHPAGEQLHADLVELAAYYEERGRIGRDLTAAELRFVVSLVRSCFAEELPGILGERAQVMVFGGASAGKSTTANVVAGVSAADVNAQAGYTRHPSAIYRSVTADTDQWPDSIGTLERLDHREAGDFDQDRYDTREVVGDVVDSSFLLSHIVWDCPDLTARDATYYEGRVIEIAAIADVCLYVASDERYNDEMPTKFLQAVVEAGKPVIVVLTKMSPYDADEFVKLFRQQVLAKLREAEGVVDVMTIPTPMAGKVADLWKEESPHGAQLRRAITEITHDLSQARRQVCGRAARYLSSRRGRLLDPLMKDLNEWKQWVQQVRQTADAAVGRYEKEYLNRVGLEDFQESRDAILQALPIPGRFAYVWKALEYLRVPYRLFKEIATRYTDPSTRSTVDESFLLDRIREQLLDSLIVSVARRRGRHEFWDALHVALADPSQLKVESRFHDLRSQQMRELRTKRADAKDRMNVKLSQSPKLLWTLRGLRLTMDAVAIVATTFLWYQFFGTSVGLIFFWLLALGLADDLARILLQEFVRREREALVSQQRDNIRQLIQASYVDELIALPKDLGARMAKLAKVAERLPQSINSLIEAYGTEERP